MSSLLYVPFRSVNRKRPRSNWGLTSVGDVLVYCRPPRPVIGKIRCGVRDIRDQVYIGWFRDERIPRALDVRDKKSDFGEGFAWFASGCVS